jgi:acyl carrier protein
VDADKIKKIISGQLGVKPEEITLEASLSDDLNCDELDIVELIFALEEAFKIEIADADFEKVKTVSDVVTLIENKTSKAG